MPTKTAEGSSMTLPCECGLRPKRLSGFGTAKVGVAPSSVPGLQAQGGRGLTPTFSLAGFVPAGNSDIQGGPSRDTATSREREGSGEALRREPDDGSEMAQETPADAGAELDTRTPYAFSGPSGDSGGASVSHPRSPNAERSTPGGAYHPAEPYRAPSFIATSLLP